MAKSDNYFLAFFNDEEPLMDALSHLKEQNQKVYEVYSPFPIHGIDDLLGYKRSRLSVAAFLFGCFGFTAGLSMQSWMLGFDWPMNIGGKPHLPFPSFVPVTFEFTILCTAFGMVGTFLFVNRFYPGKEATLPDPRITDDKFCIAIKSSDIKDVSAISQMLSKYGATEITSKEVVL